MGHDFVMHNILMLMGHPDLHSFSAQAADAYTQAARAHGATVERVNLIELSFDPVLRHGYAAEQPLEPDLVRAQQQLLAADHVVFAFPLWWSGPPALVKGFIDRVLLPDFAFKFRGKRLPEQLLAGRSARFITSMDAISLWYRLRMRSTLHTMFVTGTLQFVGFSPVRENTFYGMRHKSKEDRSRALEAIRRAAQRDVSALQARRPARLTATSLTPDSVRDGSISRSAS